MTTPTSTKPREEGHPQSGQAVDRLREAGAHVAEKAQETVSSVGALAGTALPAAGEMLGQGADSLTSAAGGQLRNLGDTVARSAPREGVLGGAAQAAAQGLKQGGDYLAREGFRGATGDLSELIRRNPLPAVCVGLGVGYLIGRILGGRS